MKKCKQCQKEIVRTSPRANNKKFCSVICRENFYIESGARQGVYERSYAKQKRERAKYQSGKIQCQICQGWYKAPLHHSWQAHEVGEREYKKMFGLDHQKGLIPEPLKELKREQVFENETVKNLKAGKKTRFVKGDKRAGRYERSQQTKERLRQHADKIRWGKRNNPPSYPQETDCT